MESVERGWNSSARVACPDLQSFDWALAGAMCVALCDGDLSLNPSHGTNEVYFRQQTGTAFFGAVRAR